MSDLIPTQHESAVAVLNELVRECDEQFERIVESICPLLAGHKPEVQGAVLAGLTAIWLAGYIVPNNPIQTHMNREALLEAHLAMVRKLIAIYAEKEG